MWMNIIKFCFFNLLLSCLLNITTPFLTVVFHTVSLVYSKKTDESLGFFSAVAALAM